MAEPTAINWKKAQISCETVKNMGIRVTDTLNESPNRLIGYEEYIDVFRSVIPLAAFDESGGVSEWQDFDEIFPEVFPGMQKTSSAFLLSGETGCGRHTADRTMMSVVLSTLEDAFYEEAADDSFDIAEEPDFNEFLRFYRLPAACFQAETDRALLRAVGEVFSQMLALAAENPSVICYFSLGSVTPVLENPKAARRFVSCMNRLTGDTRAHCIVTCLYDGRASELPDRLKQPFYVLEFEPPEEKYRREYFHYLSERYPNIRAGLTEDELTEKTEGFTFAMIKQFTAYMMMAVKSEVMAKGRNMENYLYYATIPADEVINVPKEKLERFLAMIAQARYVPKAPPVPVQTAMPYYQPPLPVQPPDGVSPGNENKGKEDKEVKGKDDEPPEMEEIDTPDELFKKRSGLMRSVYYADTDLYGENSFKPAGFEERGIRLEKFLRTAYEKGYKRLEDMEEAFFRHSGEGVIIRPKDASRLVPKDEIAPVPEGVPLYREVIVEGKAQLPYLQHLGVDREWMAKRLEQHGYYSAKDVFLGICSEDGDLIIYPY